MKALDGKNLLISLVCVCVVRWLWFGLGVFPVVVLWCYVCDLAVGGCCLCLPLLFCAFFLFVYVLLRIGFFPPGSVPPLVLSGPSVGPLAFSRPVSFFLHTTTKLAP